MWSCYIPLEAAFNAKQNTQKQYMLKINRKNVVNDYLDGTFAENYEKSVQFCSKIEYIGKRT